MSELDMNNNKFDHREMMTIPCPICNGTGKVKITTTINGEIESENVHDCQHCGGKGTVKQPKPVSMGYSMSSYDPSDDEDD